LFQHELLGGFEGLLGGFWKILETQCNPENVQLLIEAYHTMHNYICVSF